MYGLIKKDLLMIKQNLKLFMFVFVLFIGMSTVNGNDMTFILPFMSVMISISTLSYDSYNNWDAYACALPDGRRNVIRAKYVSTILFVLCSFTVAILSLFVMNVLGVNIELENAISELVGCLAAIFLIVTIMFPIMYKLGVEKGRISLFVLVFGISGIVLLFSKYMSIDIPSNIVEFFTSYYKIIVPVITIVLLYGSYKLSERIYMKKEF